MTWFTKIFTCGRTSMLRTPRKGQTETDRGNNSESGSDATQPGDVDEVHLPGNTRTESISKMSDNYVRILLRKQENEPLGLRLRHGSVTLQSIERGSALWKFSNEIPVDAIICNINGVVPTVDTIKQLLRDCRSLSTVFIAFAKPTPNITIPAVNNLVGMSRRHGSTARMSHSSTSSAAAYSPTPSQLSNMWRRVSEVGSIPTDHGALLAMPPYSGTSPGGANGYDVGGVTPIDFGKLTRDSMSMWTRPTSVGGGGGGGTIRLTTSSGLSPVDHSDEDDISGSNYRHHLTFEEEYSESPSEYKKRKESRKRASLEQT